MVTLDLNLDPAQTVVGSYDITADVDVVASKVRFFVDGAQVSEDIAYPWVYRWDTRAVADGSHTVEARVFRKNRVIAKRSVTVTVDNVVGGGGGTVNLSGTLTGTGSLSGTLAVSSGGSPLTVYWGARIRASFYQDRQSTYGTLASYADAPMNNSGPVWDLFESHAGKRVTCVQTGTGGNSWPLPAYQTSQADNARARGAFMQYSIGTTPTGLQNIIAMNASAKSSLQTFFTAVKNQGHPILCRPFWEMNGSWYAWGRPGGSGGSLLTDSDYLTLWINLWQACADVMAGVPVGTGTGTNTGNVSFFWCPNLIDVADPSGRYPGFINPKYVDWLGFDGYIAGTIYSSPATRFDATYDLLSSLDPTKPFFIGETGVNPDVASPGKAAWITAFLSTWLPAHPRVKGFSWFNEYGSPNLPHIEVGDGSSVLGGNAQAAFKAGISAPYFKDNIVTAANFPSGQKIPVPAGSGAPGGLTGFENNLEGLANGTTLTAGNTGGASGDAFTSVTGPGTSGTIQSSNAAVAHGGMAMRLATGATAEQEFVRWDNATDVTETYGRIYFRFSQLPNLTNCKLMTLRVSSGGLLLALLSVSTTALLQIRDGADVVVWTGTNAISVNTWYRLEYHYVASGATSNMEVRLYLADDATALESSGAQVTGGSSSLFKTTLYGLTTNIANLPNSVTPGHLYFDDLAAFQDGWPGPVTSSAGGKKNSAEGGTNGVTPTIADDTSGDAWSAVVGPGTAAVQEYTTVQAMHGTKSYRYATRGTSEASYLAWDNGTAISEAYGREYVRYDNINATTRVNQWRIGAASTVLAYLNLTSAGAVQLRNGQDNATSWAGPSLTANTWYRIEWYISHPSTGDSTMQIKVYAGDGGTVVTSGDSGVVTGITNAGTVGGIGYVRYGQATAVTNVPSTTGFVYLDDLAAFQTTWPGVGP